MACPPAETTPDLQTAAHERFRANLEALAVRQADLARRLSEIGLPAGTRIAAGRDGSPVGVLTEDPGHIAWLGGTSMPTVSAAETLPGPIDPYANLALASPGSGYEAPLVAHRLAHHAAVFVCAPDIRHLALALHVADWSAELRRGRLVVLAEDVEAALVEYLERHPGYQVPTRVLALPDSGGAVLSERAVAVQRAAARADAAQQRAIARIAEQIARRRRGPGAAHPRVLVVSIDAVGGAVDFCGQAQHALAALGFSAAVSVPDAPERCHRIVRLAALRDHDPQWVLFVNCTPGPLGDYLSPDVACACWFLESATLPANAFAGLAHCDHLYAGSAAVRNLLIAQGARPETVKVLEPGVDDTVFRRLRREALDPADRCDVALVSDVCDAAPQAAGIGLESHERLWSAVEEQLVQALRRGAEWGASAEELLNRAERATGVQLSDVRLRAEFRALLANRLIGTVTAREVARALRPLGRVSVWGAGWEAEAEFQPIWRGPLPGAAARNRMYQQAAVVVFPHFGPASVRGAFEVLAAGGCPILPRMGQQALANYPAGCEILSRIPAFAGLPDLLQTVRGLAGGPVARAQAVAAARVGLLAGLTLPKRLLALHAEIAAGSAAPAGGPAQAGQIAPADGGVILTHH